MVDIFVGPLESPVLRVDGKISLHVFVDQLLQIHSQGCAVGADDDIGADAGICRDITPGVVQNNVRRIVSHIFGRPVFRGLYDHVGDQSAAITLDCGKSGPLVSIFHSAEHPSRIIAPLR